MSTSGISNNSLSQLETSLTNAQQFLTDFQHLGTDLKSGDLNASQQDFVTLSQDAQNASATLSVTGDSSTPQRMQSDFQTLQKELNSGDLGAARQAYAQIVQDTHPAAASEANNGAASAVSTLLAELSSLNHPANAAAAAGSTAAATGGSDATATVASDATGGAVNAAEQARLEGGSPPELGLSVVSALALVLKQMGSFLHAGDVPSAQKSLSEFTQQIQAAVESISGLSASSSAATQGSAQTAKANATSSLSVNA